MGGTLLEELMGPLDASCTRAAIHGGAPPPGTDKLPAAIPTDPSDEEKSIVPVSALPSSYTRCVISAAC